MLEKRNFNLLKNIKGVLLLLLLFFFSCNLQFKRKIEQKDSKIEDKLFFENPESKQSLYVLHFSIYC